MPTLYNPAQRTMLWGAALFTASGLFHVGVWLWAGAPSLEGPVSWRKPIAFGLSLGVLAASLTWVLGLLPPTRALRRQALAVVLLLVAELTLIDLQQWRGVGSHFNVATPLDEAIFNAMGIIILIAAAIMVVWTRAVWRPLAAPAGEVIAARGGMTMLTVGNVLGIVLAGVGVYHLAQGLPPNVFGAAGQMRVPHAVALHALQVLPLLAWLARPLPDAARVVGVATYGYVGLLGFAVMQTFSGRAPEEVTVLSAVVLLASVVALSLAGVRAVAGRAAAARQSGMLVR